MVIDRGDLFQIDSIEQNLHVFQRIDRYAALADLAFARGMIGVVAHQRREIECDRKPASAVLQQILVALVRFLRRCEAGKHAHRPKPAR